MLINPTIKKTNKTIFNKEQYKVYAENPGLELFLSASNLKPKKAFYEDDTVKAFIAQLQKLPKSEYQFVISLANYFNSIGIKLSPLIILNVLGKSEIKNLSHIFDRPDKIANYISLNGGFRTLKTCEKKGLKKALENIHPITLKKMQLKGREIKTKDLIKMLRPKPINDFAAKTYKEIIENKAKVETLLTKKSSNKEEATEYFENNIDKMPINMLIRNLRMYSTTKNPIKTRNEILAKLEAKITDRLLNPFDLVNVAIEVPTLELEMNKLLNDFSSKAMFKLVGNTGVLFDVSGSMRGDGVNDGFKNLVLLNKILKSTNLHFFSDSVYDVDPFILKYLNDGKIQTAKNYLEKVFDKLSGGTRLLDSLALMSTRYDNVIVISDEVTWEDDYTIESYKNVMKGKNLIVVNPKKYEGTVFKNKFLSLASIEAKIMLYLNMLVDFNSFKQWIIKNYYPAKN